MICFKVEDIVEAVKTLNPNAAIKVCVGGFMFDGIKLCPNSEGDIVAVGTGNISDDCNKDWERGYGC